MKEIQDESQPTSEARLEANRRNAETSTGPRTAAGKARSARNSVKHGLYSTNPMAIHRGPFVEDESDVAGFFDGLVESLAPRDEAEAAQARTIAATHVRLRRLDRFEAAALDADGRLDDAQLGVLGGDESALMMEWGLLLEMSNLIAEPAPPPTPGEDVLGSDVDYRALCRVLVGLRKERLAIRDVWDDTREPATPAQWRIAYETLVRHWWPEPTDMEVWLTAGDVP